MSAPRVAVRVVPESVRPLPTKSVMRSPPMKSEVPVALVKERRARVEELFEIRPPLKVKSEPATSAWSLRRKLEEATPPSCLASKADGTEPIALRGVISASASIVTPRYSGWLKLTLVSDETLPSITEKRPSVMVTSFPPLRVSLQIATPPVGAV